MNQDGSSFIVARAAPTESAVVQGHLSVVEYLVSRGVAVETVSYTNVSPVMIRMRFRIQTCCQKLYQIGGTLLTCAAKCGHFPVIEFLLEKGADIEANDYVSGNS